MRSPKTANGTNSIWINKLANTFRIGVAFLLVFGMLLQGSSDAAAAGNARLRVHYFPSLPIMLPVWVAYEKGMFTARGLDVVLIGIPGPVAVAALAGNSIDVVQFTPTHMLAYNVKNRQQRVSQISATFEGMIYSLIGTKGALASCPDSNRPFPTPLKCLKGKRVGVIDLGADNYELIHSLLSQVSMTDKDVQIVPTGSTAGAANMLRTNQIDYSAIAEPGVTQIVDLLKSGRELIKMSDNPLMSRWTGEASYAFTAAIDKDPKKFQSYARAINDAVAFIRDQKNFEESKRIYLKYAKLDPSLASAILKRNLTRFSAKNDCESVNNAIAWMEKANQIKKGSVAGCSDLLMRELKP